MKKLLLFGSCLAMTINSIAQETKKYPEPEPMTPGMSEYWTPQPKKVKTDIADKVVKAPSDAIILFDGTSSSAWVSGNGEPCQWIVKDGVMTVNPGKGDIATKEKFSDCQLHIEWRAPKDVQGESQGRGNSGLFMQERYEVQILESEGTETYANGQAGSIYKQTPPLVNATRAAGDWNIYDVIFKAPTFKEDGTLKTNGTITVLHNGVVIQNNTIILGSTEYVGFPKNSPHGAASIKLQDHGNPMQFRNIWLRKLD